MGNLSAATRGDLAACQLTAGVAPTFGFNRGFLAAITRTGLGDYTLTLDQGASLNSEAGVTATALSATSAMICVEPLAGNTQLRIRTFTGANAAADINFSLRVTDYGPV